MAERFHYYYRKQLLKFKKAAGTSRGILLEKPSYIIHVVDREMKITGTGECSILPGLSPDDLPEIEQKIKNLCQDLNAKQVLEIPYGSHPYPAVKFGFETALLDLSQGGRGILFDNAFSRGEAGIKINGLIWMDNLESMRRQVKEKVAAGFHCIKCKIGALDFSSELAFIKDIRQQYPDIELRLDANGAFPPSTALDKLERVSKYNIHSIEQPIRQGQWAEMAQLCKTSPIPIALDEELIGIRDMAEKEHLLNFVRPQYLILKPSLTGGTAASEEWIRLAEKFNIGWWATSALESNIGLNAIAQWVADIGNPLPQGLGTGSLFENNIEMPLEVRGDELWRLRPPMN